MFHISFLDVRIAVGQVSKAGWLEMAEARKSTGSRSVSRLQLPSTEGEREVAFFQLTRSKFQLSTWRFCISTWRFCMLT